jgi:uncharacterized membrane protein
MSEPRVKSGRLARVAIGLMIVLGLFSIVVSVPIAIILIALGVTMYLFEWWLVRKANRAQADD